jgi:uncharacterized protein YbjT (DUF2867 family)
VEAAEIELDEIEPDEIETDEENAMKVLVFGATGKTGRLVVERAMAKGHAVTVLVRDASRFHRTGVRVLMGDATNLAEVLAAMKGQDVVVDTIGGTKPYKAQELERRAARVIIDAMRMERVRRLIVVSMMGLGESRMQAPWWYRTLLMRTFLRGSSPDKEAMERLVRASGLEYVIVRPPILKDEPATGKVTVLEGGTGHSITRGDLSEFLVEQVTNDAYVGRGVTVVNE